MNDQNLEEPSRYVSGRNADMLVEPKALEHFVCDGEISLPDRWICDSATI